MKHLIIRIISLAFLVLGMQAQAMEVVELKQANSNKVVFKVRFANGSVSDPAGKQGLTYATASLMSQGGAGGVSYADIQDILHPWAAGYGAAVDKQVTTFTFQVPAVFVDEFYPILKNVLLAPDFTDKDFSRVMKNQQNYVDQVVRASSDEDYSKFALEHQLFRGGNMQHLRQGTSEAVKGISLEDIRSHYQNAFTRHNVSIGIAGNYNDALLETFKADMAKLSEKAFFPKRPSHP
jgi:zinc protease